MMEDYVSFETAKLLKEKGFNWNTDKQYYLDKIVGDYDITDRSRNPERYLDAPTLQMAMKWLRKVYNLEIYPYHQYSQDGNKWWFEIVKFPSPVSEYESNAIYATYEEAVEAAIKYCLEKLI